MCGVFSYHRVRGYVITFVVFRSGVSLALTLSGHVMSRLISKKSIIQELPNMYPEVPLQGTC